jgi:hypothetical protein
LSESLVAGPLDAKSLLIFSRNDFSQLFNLPEANFALIADSISRVFWFEKGIIAK